MSSLVKNVFADLLPFCWLWYLFFWIFFNLSIFQYPPRHPDSFINFNWIMSFLFLKPTHTVPLSLSIRCKIMNMAGMVQLLHSHSSTPHTLFLYLTVCIPTTLTLNSSNVQSLPQFKDLEHLYSSEYFSLNVTISEKPFIITQKRSPMNFFLPIYFILPIYFFTVAYQTLSLFINYISL